MRLKVSFVCTCQRHWICRTLGTFRLSAIWVCSWIGACVSSPKKCWSMDSTLSWQVWRKVVCWRCRWERDCFQSVGRDGQSHHQHWGGPNKSSIFLSAYPIQLGKPSDYLSWLSFGLYFLSLNILDNPSEHSLKLFFVDREPSIEKKAVVSPRNHKKSVIDGGANTKRGRVTVSPFCLLHGCWRIGDHSGPPVRNCGTVYEGGLAGMARTDPSY